MLLFNHPEIFWVHPSIAGVFPNLLPLKSTHQLGMRSRHLSRERQSSLAPGREPREPQNPRRDGRRNAWDASTYAVFDGVSMVLYGVLFMVLDRFRWCFFLFSSWCLYGLIWCYRLLCREMGQSWDSEFTKSAFWWRCWWDNPHHQPLPWFFAFSWWLCPNFVLQNFPCFFGKISVPQSD